MSVPQSTLSCPRVLMNRTNEASQYFGMCAAVPMYTLGCFHAAAISSSTHGQPVCEATNFSSGKSHATSSTNTGRAYDELWMPPECPIWTTTGTSSSQHLVKNGYHIRSLMGPNSYGWMYAPTNP